MYRMSLMALIVGDLPGVNRERWPSCVFLPSLGMASIVEYWGYNRLELMTEYVNYQLVNGYNAAFDKYRK